MVNPMDDDLLPAFLFDTGSASHVGQVRSLNEDRCVARPDLGLWAVADGMGGHKAGDVASTALAEALGSIGRAISAPDLLARFEDRVLRANASIRKVAALRGGIIGSTLAALLVFGRHYACVWSGDSRVYLLRNGDLRQLSRDHSEVQDLVDSGAMTLAEARTSPQRNVITRAIGVTPEPELEITQGDLQDGDRFLICSDGLTTHVEDVEIKHTIDRQEAQSACNALIALTLERGATDNV